MKRSYLLFLVLFVIVFSAMSVFADESLNETKPIVLATTTDQVTFEPAQSATKNDTGTLNMIFDALLKLDDDLTLKPTLAESYELLDTPEKNIWQFKLRQGIKFSNGEDFGASDVKFSFERAADPANGFTGNIPGYVFGSIGFQGVEIVDDYTVNIILSGYNPDAPAYFAECWIVPEGYYSENTNEFVAKNPVGSGPYVLQEWVPDDHITLVRNDNYWGEPAAVKTIIIRPIPERSTAVAELLMGNVDVVSGVSADQAGTIDASGVAHVEAVTGGRRVNLGFLQTCEGQGCEEVKDVRVRQALNYGTDIQTILDAFFNGKATRAAGFVNPPNALESLEPYPYDPDKAKELLAEAGYPDGFKCVIGSPNGRYQKDKELAIAIAADWKKIGVDCEVIPYEWTVYTQMLDTHTTPAIFLIGNGSNFSSAWYDMSTFASPTQTSNYPQWGNEEFSGLVEKLGTTYDPAERVAITDRMQQILHDECPWLWIYMQVDWYAVNNNLKWTPRHDEVVEFVHASW